MNYGNYGYGEGRPYGEGYGNYGMYVNGPKGGSYGRRGVDRRYAGPEQKLEEMMQHYGNYSAAAEAMNMGNYGAQADTMKSLDYMLKSVCNFMSMLEQNAGSQEEVQLIKKYARQIGEEHV